MKASELDLQGEPHRRFDPLCGNWVLVSPHRTARPWQGQTESVSPVVAVRHDPHCYLCPGNVRAGGGVNPQYSSTYVFDNDFGALLPPSGAGPRRVAVAGLLEAESESGRCRVMCYSPHHDLSLGGMSLDAIRAVIDTWAQETGSLGVDPRVNAVTIFENRGAMMGASSPHPHGQIWANETVPHVLRLESSGQQQYLRQQGRCLLCDYAALEIVEAQRIVCANEHFVAVVPFWATWPFETLLLPRVHAPSLERLGPAVRDGCAQILKELTLRYDALFGVAFPYTMGVHQQPTDGADHPEWHMHLHFYPPLLRSASIRKFMVGYEMLAGPQRDITPEAAAGRLRDVSRPMRPDNRVQLITYVDRLGGGGFRELAAVLAGPLHGLFGGVHLLPFYEPIDGSDAGFDPIDHTRVDERLGTWSDVAALARSHSVMADVIVNHISDRSPQFRDFEAHGSASAYDGLFLTREQVFPETPDLEDLAKIYRPRPGLPFREVTLANGERRTLWTTFTPHQLDIDVTAPQGRAYLAKILSTLASSGVHLLRLDAVGYAIKKAGTSCFMLPETFEFIGEFAGQARALGMDVLVEIHSYYQRQIEIASRVDWVYDFALPPLVLHAFTFGTAAALKDWIRIRPVNAITVLDTHDGIGIIDIGADPEDRSGRPGLVDPAHIDRLVEAIHERSGGESRKATGAAASNLDLYQVNCTFLDAMGGDERRYLLARAIQFFLPGIPQVYYVGLLAGHNDMALLARTQVGRDINRHHYSPGEIQSAIQKPVVRDLFELIRLRNSHAAFGGGFELQDTSAKSLALRWAAGSEFAMLTVQLDTAAYELIFSTPAGVGRLEFTSNPPGIYEP